MELPDILREYIGADEPVDTSCRSNAKTFQTDKGYFIKCVYVLTVDPLINVARVKTRVDAGGHDVPREKIVSRYKKALANIPVLIELCDIMHVYDNSDEKVCRIIRKHKDELTIFPNDIWTEEKIIELMEGK